jgi:hypothetical protein
MSQPFPKKTVGSSFWKWEATPILQEQVGLVETHFNKALIGSWIAAILMVLIFYELEAVVLDRGRGAVGKVVWPIQRFGNARGCTRALGTTSI